MRTIIIRPAAEADLAAACGWYDQQRPGLGDRFLDAAAAAARFIAEHPEAYQVIHGVRGVRPSTGSRLDSSIASNQM
jgi:plasmid stabilization system protein ParE